MTTHGIDLLRAEQDLEDGARAIEAVRAVAQDAATLGREVGATNELLRLMTISGITATGLRLYRGGEPPQRGGFCGRRKVHVSTT